MAAAAAFRGISRFLNGGRNSNSLRLHHNPTLTPSLLVSTRGIVSKLFVGGLSFYTSEKNLAETFAQFGQVIEAKIITERGSDRSKGFGFVTYASEDEAQKAIEGMNGKDLNGRIIYVDIAKANQGFIREGTLVARGPPEPEGDLTEKGKTTKRLLNKKKEPSGYDCM